MSNEQRDIVERMNAWFNEKGHSLGYSTYEMLREAAEEITTLCRRVENATNGAKFWTDAHEAMCKHLWTVVQPRDGLGCDVLAVQEIERLRKIEADAKAANMIGPDGNLRKVLGTLPMTADGAILGWGSYPLSIIRGHRGIVETYGSANSDQGWSGPTQWSEPEDCYSTPEAADEAARNNRSNP